MIWFLSNLVPCGLALVQGVRSPGVSSAACSLPVLLGGKAKLVLWLQCSLVSCFRAEALRLVLSNEVVFVQKHPAQNSSGSVSQWWSCCGWLWALPVSYHVPTVVPTMSAGIGASMPDPGTNIVNPGTYKLSLNSVGPLYTEAWAWYLPYFHILHILSQEKRNYSDEIPRLLSISCMSLLYK